MIYNYYIIIYKLINLIHHLNRLKDLSHLIISLDTERSFDTIQHPFTIAKERLEMEQTCLNIRKLIHNKTLANIMLNGENFKRFPLMNKARVSVYFLRCFFYLLLKIVFIHTIYCDYSFPSSLLLPLLPTIQSIPFLSLIIEQSYLTNNNKRKEIK